MRVLGALGALAALAPLGAGTLLLTGAWRRAAGLLRAGLAVFTGMAAAAAALPPLLYAGLSPTVPVVLLLGAAVLAAGIAVERRRTPRPRPVRLAIAPALLLALPVALLGVDAVQRRVSGYDAFANWALKAKLLALHGGWLTGALDERTLATTSIAPPLSRQFPLGLPALHAVVLHGTGSTDFRAAQLLFVALPAGLALVCWGVLRPSLPAGPLAAGLLALLFMPALRQQALTDYADVPLACFFVAAALLLGLWLADRTPGALPLAAVFAAAALATKRDAIALCGVLAAVAVGGAAIRGAPLRGLALALACAAASTVPWRVFVAVHHLHDRDVGLAPGRVADHAGQLGWVLRTLGGFLVRGEYLWVVPLAAAAALVLLRRGPGRSLAAGSLVLGAGLLLALVFVYLNGAAGVHYLVRTSGHRTLLPAVVLAAALLPLLLTRALRSAPADDRRRSRAVP